jgi:hypothetical protein
MLPAMFLPEAPETAQIPRVAGLASRGPPGDPPGGVTRPATPPMTGGLFGLFMLIALSAWARSALVPMLESPVLKSLDELSWSFAFASLALAGFFPLSAIVYEISQSAPRETELARDLRLLNCRNSDEHIKSCRKFYAQWNYALRYLLAIVPTVLGVSLFFHPPSTEANSW